jgi:deazaflavin-dependent oxidoreductase (nitroreductase family)
VSDWNQNIVEEFRANDGKVGGMFEGAPLLILHHAGAKTGTERITPLMYQPLDSGRVAVFASAAGAHKHPDWYYNIVANPDTKAEIGSDTVVVNARVAAGDEHDRIWNHQKATWPQFAEYEAKTNREVIPVVVLEPAV